MNQREFIEGVKKALDENDSESIFGKVARNIEKLFYGS